MSQHKDGPKHGTRVFHVPMRYGSASAYNEAVSQRKRDQEEIESIRRQFARPHSLTDDEMKRRAAALAATNQCRR
jgi:hypothetical protein